MAKTNSKYETNTINESKIYKKRYIVCIVYSNNRKYYVLIISIFEILAITWRVIT